MNLTLFNMLRISICLMVSALLATLMLQANLLLAADQRSSIDIVSTVNEPSVAENINNMDTNRDGIVTVYEVRAFVESKHGKGYQANVLDGMESSAAGKSCSSPFSKPLY